MKIIKKMLDNLFLDNVPDAPDGARAAITNDVQAFEGFKVFKDGISVGQDDGKNDESIVCKADLNELSNEDPVPVIDIITITQQNITAKEISLTLDVYEESKGLTKFKMAGSTWFLYGIHFDLVDKTISWQGDLRLRAGDVIIVQYMGVGV